LAPEVPSTYHEQLTEEAILIPLGDREEQTLYMFTRRGDNSSKRKLLRCALCRSWGSTAGGFVVAFRLFVHSYRIAHRTGRPATGLPSFAWRPYVRRGAAGIPGFNAKPSDAHRSHRWLDRSMMTICTRLRGLQSVARESNLAELASDFDEGSELSLEHFLDPYLRSKNSSGKNPFDDSMSSASGHRSEGHRAEQPSSGMGQYRLAQ
jgi:hypothetical protein